MNSGGHRAARAVALAAVVVFPVIAQAGLRDRGAVDPATGYPLWYRDHKGVPLALCLSQTPSPNAGAGGSPMCFPPAPDPEGWPGNWGAEAFYAMSDAIITNARIDARLTLALEAAYISELPVRGEEIVFARYRIRIDTPVAGTYTITHPYGARVYRNVPAGGRAINDTVDIGVAQGLFQMVLDGHIGPFLEWDVLDFDPASNPPRRYSLTTANGEQYLGDPNIPHTVKGSPNGTNYFRIDGPPGSNLDGLGNDFVQTNLFSVVGKRYLGPIEALLDGDRAVFACDGSTMNLHVFSTAPVGSSLVVSAAGIPSSPMLPDGFGKYYAHLSYAGSTPPASVTVTNFSDTPVSTKQVPVGDAILATAVYDSSVGLLDVQATSSDQRSPGGPSLTTPGLPGALGSAPGNPQIRTLALLTDVPPSTVTVNSASGGTETVRTFVISAATPGGSPVAVPDTAATAEDTLVAIPVLANDTPATGTILVHDAPVNGQAVVNAVTGTIDYTPAANWSGVETFAYMLQDSATGLLSNAASVTVTVLPLNDAPTAVNDLASTGAGVARAVAVLANDSDPDGAIAPASLAVAVAPANGTAVVSSGTVLYTPAPGFVGQDAFGYTVADDGGAVSAIATVHVTVTSGAEALTAIARWEIAKRRWTITGASTVFGPSIANVVTVRNGPNATYAQIGTAQIDALGAFVWQPAPGEAPAPDATRRVTLVSTGGAQLTVSVTFK